MQCNDGCKCFRGARNTNQQIHSQSAKCYQCASGTVAQVAASSSAPFLRGPRQMTGSSAFGSMKPMLITPRFSCRAHTHTRSRACRQTQSHLGQRLPTF